MGVIVWDQVGERRFETGIDRGVFYSPHHLTERMIVGEGSYGSGEFYPQGFPWNGLISVDIQPENASTSALYYDGQKTLDIIEPGDFSASLKAFTYPDEFIEYDGFAELSPGILLDNQSRDTFGLSYRTLMGNDLLGVDRGYKIHILYNVTAVEDSPSYQTIDSNIDPIDFSWNLTCVPEQIPGHRPSAHIILDSTKINEEVLAEIEQILYGAGDNEPRLPTIAEIIDHVSITITDHGDGTWTADGPEYLIQMLDEITFQIDGANATYLDEDTYRISST